MSAIKFGILTVSDRSSQGVRLDASGPALEGVIAGQGWEIARKEIVPDEVSIIRRTLEEWSDSGELDVILTTGGTGFSPRDVTPEATLSAIERGTPGLAEAMRFASLRTTPHAMLSRAIAGIRRQTLIVNLPGSPKGAVENLQVILAVLPHAVELLKNDPRAEAGHSRD
jgi:molybdenum cofactor synthesis domain-containing protein